MKKRSAWFAAWFAVLIIGVVAMMAVAPMGKAAEQKQFIVGFDAEFPPYGYMDDNGEYVGFDLDLAAEVCKRNGWKLVKRPIAWDSKDSELATGAISCIWNGFTMNGREDNYTWSTAYVDNSQVVIVSKVFCTSSRSFVFPFLKPIPYSSEERRSSNIRKLSPLADI